MIRLIWGPLFLLIFAVGPSLAFSPEELTKYSEECARDVGPKREEPWCKGFWVGADFGRLDASEATGFNPLTQWNGGTLFDGTNITIKDLDHFLGELQLQGGGGVPINTR